MSLFLCSHACDQWKNTQSKWWKRKLREFVWVVIFLLISSQIIVTNHLTQVTRIVFVCGMGLYLDCPYWVGRAFLWICVFVLYRWSECHTCSRWLPSWSRSRKAAFVNLFIFVIVRLCICVLVHLCICAFVYLYICIYKGQIILVHSWHAQVLDWSTAVGQSSLLREEKKMMPLLERATLRKRTTTKWFVHASSWNYHQWLAIRKKT